LSGGHAEESQHTWRGDVSDQTNSIRELAKAWMRSAWAAALFGVSQIVRVRWENNSECRADSLESVTRAVESQLSEGMRMVFQTGDQLQRGITNAMFSALAGDAEVPRLAAKTAVDLAQFAAATAAALIPERENRLAWLELQNKLETFNLFAHVDLAMDLPRTCASLAELVEHASCLGPYRSVWATEGVGHLYAELRSACGAHIDLGAQANALPSSSLVALHSGAGLSFAGRCLEAITARSAGAQVRATLDRFVALCNENSHQAYVGAAYEALGLATRNLHPHLLSDIDRYLAEIDEELVAYFWHGVGRGIYFAPTNLLPNGAMSRRIVKQAQQEPPHDLARLNALSGLIWALVLVNIRHSEIIEAFMRDNDGELDGELFANALCSAAVIWRDSSPHDNSLSALCRHRPPDARTAALWDSRVSRRCNEVVNHYYPMLRNAGLGRLFRHQSLSELMAGLEAGSVREHEP
jgi:hypothetical protein